MKTKALTAAQIDTLAQRLDGSVGSASMRRAVRSLNPARAAAVR
jgi:hypothetical protein